MNFRSQLSILLEECCHDMKTAASEGRIALDAQIRAYDLHEMLLEQECDSPDQAREFRDVFDELKDRISDYYDENYLLERLKARLAPLERACTDARFEAAAAASLHEFTKESYSTWQTAGIFMRKRVLKALRERAGFKLEAHRIGNYVAKTFDLMNEAQMNFARAQQAVFAADVTYKIRPDLYGKIYEIVSK